MDSTHWTALKTLGFVSLTLSLFIGLWGLQAMLVSCGTLLFFLWGLYLSVYTCLSSQEEIRPVLARPIVTPLITQEESRSGESGCKLSIGVEPIVRELIELILRDHISSWYNGLAADKSTLLQLLRSDLMHLASVISDLLAKVDWLSFLTEDIPDTLTSHIRDVQLASRQKDGECRKPFVLHECANNRELEKVYLLQLATLLIQKAKPVHWDAVTVSLVEGIVCSQVLLPLVDSCSNPDNINLSLLSYLKSQEQLSRKYKKTFSYAASYEDFVELITKCTDLEQLKQIRYHVITEIIHSTTIINLKKLDESEAANSKKAEPAQAGSSKLRAGTGIKKADMLKSRDLKRYMNQLRIAKDKCERRITDLGGPDYNSPQEEAQLAQQHRAVPFPVTIHNLECRGCFHAFLKADDCESLLEFWVAVETLKSCDASDKHRLANEIYNKYIASKLSRVRLEKSLMRDMEAFLIGNKGPDAFYVAQEQVCRQLEEKFYPEFIVCEMYHKFIVNWDEKRSTDSGETKSVSSAEENMEEEAEHADEQQIISHAEFTRAKIQELDCKIFNKTQAHQVLLSNRMADAADSKYEHVIVDLENQLERLKVQRRALEAHQEQADSWWRNIGKWNASVVSSEIIKEDDKWKIYFVVLVRLNEHSTESPVYSSGWVISRSLSQFRELYDQLLQVDENIDCLPFPSKVRLGKPSEDYMNKAKGQLSAVLDWVLRNKYLAQSQPLFSFISTHQELTIPRTRSGFAIPKLFTRQRNPSSETASELLFYSTADDVVPDMGGRDSIAGSLYALISEVFELKSASKLLRKTLVQLVQVTYGKSINRQIKETVNWFVSTPMVVYYLRFWKDFFWPPEPLEITPPHRSDRERNLTRIETKATLLSNIPEVMPRIFGEKTSRKGVAKVFETFQLEDLNRHFFYVLLSKFLEALLPEYKETKCRTVSKETETENTAESLDSVLDERLTVRTDTVTETVKRPTISDKPSRRLVPLKFL